VRQVVASTNERSANCARPSSSRWLIALIAEAEKLWQHSSSVIARIATPSPAGGHHLLRPLRPKPQTTTCQSRSPKTVEAWALIIKNCKLIKPGSLFRGAFLYETDGTLEDRNRSAAHGTGPRLVTGAAFIAVVILSLGLGWSIWAAIRSLAMAF
jgi:hypothetical protein